MPAVAVAVVARWARVLTGSVPLWPKAAPPQTCLSTPTAAQTPVLAVPARLTALRHLTASLRTRVAPLAVVNQALVALLPQVEPAATPATAVAVVVAVDEHILPEPKVLAPTAVGLDSAPLTPRLATAAPVAPVAAPRAPPELLVTLSTRARAEVGAVVTLQPVQPCVRVALVAPEAFRAEAGAGAGPRHMLLLPLMLQPEPAATAPEANAWSRSSGEPTGRAILGCMSYETQRRWRLANAEKTRAYHRKWARENRYGCVGATDEEREGPCEVPGCPYVGPLHWDHDHADGRFRGWICGACNRALGLVKDDPVRCLGLARYLERA